MAERPILFSAPMIRAVLLGTKTQTRRTLRVQPPAGTFQVSTWHHPDPRPHFFSWQELPHQTAMIADDWAYPCLYGATGDRLWVREAFNDDRAEIIYRADGGLPGDWCDAGSRWRPSIHMPRAASRITLEVTEVRVERLQDISEADAIAEGIAELVPAGKRSEGLTPAALAFAAAATVDALPRIKRRGFLAGALAASLGFVASPSRPWEVKPGRMTRAPSPRQLYALLWESINGPGSWEANPWVWCVSFRRCNG